MPQHNDLLNLYTAKSSPKNQQKPISFRELTAEFDRFVMMYLIMIKIYQTFGHRAVWHQGVTWICKHNHNVNVYTSEHEVSMGK